MSKIVVQLVFLTLKVSFGYNKKANHFDYTECLVVAKLLFR